MEAGSVEKMSGYVNGGFVAGLTVDVLATTFSPNSRTSYTFYFRCMPLTRKTVIGDSDEA